MTYRDLSELTKTQAFQSFIKEFNLGFILKEGNILLKNECVLLHIYGFYIEDWIYFELVNLRNKTYCSDMNSIEYDLDDSILKLYEYYKKIT
jgi:hypothetical protein